MTDASTALILTLALDADAQQLFDSLRQEHFPPERNFLRAHVTLFHHLPGQHYATISTQLAEIAAQEAALSLAVTGLRFLGRGVAYTLENQRLRALHQELQQRWSPYLTPQDQQKLQPHVTVQNKAAPAVARALHQQLSEEFVPFGAVGTGLQLWAYRNGPWEALQTFPFGA